MPRNWLTNKDISKLKVVTSVTIDYSFDRFPHRVAYYDQVANFYLAKMPWGWQFWLGLIFGSEEYLSVWCLWLWRAGFSPDLWWMPWRDLGMRLESRCIPSRNNPASCGRRTLLSPSHMYTWTVCTLKMEIDDTNDMFLLFPCFSSQSTNNHCSKKERFHLDKIQIKERGPTLISSPRWKLWSPYTSGASPRRLSRCSWSPQSQEIIQNHNSPKSGVVKSSNRHCEYQKPKT